MNDEKWQDLKIKVKEKFADAREEKLDASMEDDIGQVIPGTMEVLEFTSPLGEIRLEHTVRAKVLDKKEHYNRTQAGHALVEYIVSENEKSYKLDIFKKDDLGEWRKLEVPAENLSF